MTDRNATARSTSAGLALQVGDDLQLIQEKLGCSSIVLTTDTCVSAEPELARLEAESTARLVLHAAHSGPRRLRSRRRAGIPATGASKHMPAVHTAGHPYRRGQKATAQ